MDYAALLHISNRHLYENNSFRITGLSVDTTVRETSKHLDKMKMLSELGQTDLPVGGALALHSPPTTDQLREAHDRLRDPARRILDEFFWVWPETFGKSATDEALLAIQQEDVDKAVEIWRSRESHPSGIVATHNLAVVNHLLAIDWENYFLGHTMTEAQEHKVSRYWDESVARWEQLSLSDEFWSLFSMRIRIADDPRLTTGISRHIRHSLPRALDLVNADLAVAFLDKDRDDFAAFHVSLMRSSHQGCDELERTFEEALHPHKHRIQQHLSQLRTRRASSDAVSSGEIDDLIALMSRAFKAYTLFFPSGHEIQAELFDDAALACNQLIAGYHKAHNMHSTCIDYLKKILPFPRTHSIKKQLSDNIKTLQQFDDYDVSVQWISSFDPFFEGSDPPAESLSWYQSNLLPRLASATAGLGDTSEAAVELHDAAAFLFRKIAADAWNRHRDTKTARTAIGLARQYARKPETRQKLARDEAIVLGIV